MGQGRLTAAGHAAQQHQCFCSASSSGTSSRWPARQPSQQTADGRWASVGGQQRAAAQRQLDDAQQQLAVSQTQLAAARREVAATNEGMEVLREAVAAEAAATATVLDKAESAAQLLGQQLLSVMQQRQQEQARADAQEGLAQVG